MRWLIVEDALRDRKGHWFEYLCAFYDELRALGDEVEMLVDKKAEPFILERLEAKAVLPESIWHRMNDRAGLARRFARVLNHAWQIHSSIQKWFAVNPAPDVVFVPTVLVHHLLGWAWLIKRRKLPSRVLLFFPNLPINLDARGEPAWVASPTTRLLTQLLVWLKPELMNGRVILGVETQAMRSALSALTNLPVSYFPHPVSHSALHLNCNSNTELRFACYGPARHEKGSDILVAAISAYLRRYPDSRARFIFQWLDDFRSETGALVSLDPSLLADSRVEVIRRYFTKGEYSEFLLRTDAMLLPYRASSYGLRVSRVAIEAMVNGIPAVTTHKTTLWSQLQEFGSGVSCEDGNVESLVQAMRELELRHEQLRTTALRRCAAAQHHFSVHAFRDLLLLPRSKGDISPGQIEGARLTTVAQTAY